MMLAASFLKRANTTMGRGTDGERFVEAVEAEFVLLLQFPEIGRRLRKNVRRRNISRWPYGIVYVLDANELVVIAIAHNRRRPEYWRTRLR
jgi:plasmid stabilization system protein ParE